VVVAKHRSNTVRTDKENTGESRMFNALSGIPALRPNKAARTEAAASGLVNTADRTPGAKLDIKVSEKCSFSFSSSSSSVVLNPSLD
jgi:hypothetical protein